VGTSQFEAVEGAALTSSNTSPGVAKTFSRRAGSDVPVGGIGGVSGVGGCCSMRISFLVQLVTEVKTIRSYKEIPNSHIVYNGLMPCWKSRARIAIRCAIAV
jgi:hypothetical protein